MFKNNERILKIANSNRLEELYGLRENLLFQKLIE